MLLAGLGADGVTSVAVQVLGGGCWQRLEFDCVAESRRFLGELREYTGGVGVDEIVDVAGLRVDAVGLPGLVHAFRECEVVGGWVWWCWVGRGREWRGSGRR